MRSNVQIITSGTRRTDTRPAAQSGADQITAAAMSVGRADLAPGLIRQGLSVDQAKCRLFDEVTGYRTPSQRRADESESTALLVGAMRNLDGKSGGTFPSARTDDGVALMSAAAKNHTDSVR